MVGQIGGWTPPFQLSVAQIVVLLVSVVIESQTWRWWGTHLPAAASVAVAVGVPLLLVWVVRCGRLEGRSLARATVGWLAFLTRPRRGRVGGRSYGFGRRAFLGGGRVFVAAGGRR